mgnify:CR=1 FL=1
MKFQIGQQRYVENVLGQFSQQYFIIFIHILSFITIIITDPSTFLVSRQNGWDKIAGMSIRGEGERKRKEANVKSKISLLLFTQNLTYECKNYLRISRSK